MKIEIKREETKNFVPIKLSLTFESQRELSSLWTIATCLKEGRPFCALTDESINLIKELHKSVESAVKGHYDDRVCKLCKPCKHFIEE